MKNLFKSFMAMFSLTIVLGLVYPFFIMAIGYGVAHNQATGSQVYYNGNVVGSELIGQTMPDNLFQSRPSASGYNPLATGGTNYAVNNQTQLQDVKNRIKDLQAKYGVKPIPEDLVFASGSGVDPEISLQAALYQSAYIAQKNNLSIDQVNKLIQENTKEHLFNIATVNVLPLNIALLQLIGKNSQGISSLI
ncbi:potassium-transporting ATPase subunit C [Francisella philomiragia]|uniref:potassium-transporting ATPase subunit C n=1 Tax=Francisella philomiragia TaxID=28110 RepID=UPI001903EAEB|nr:potassium-transporting ATPase subunit C [Francisella philomiragia]MBK2105770.1 potassium-transporting ATPase subunit C [Francisella philomiragia]